MLLILERDRLRIKQMVFLQTPNCKVMDYTNKYAYLYVYKIVCQIYIFGVPIPYSTYKYIHMYIQ